MMWSALRCPAYLPRHLGKSAKVSLYFPRRHVATWTPLAAAFNRKPQKKLLSIFNKQRKGLFGIPQLADPTGFYLLREQAEIDAERLVREATSSTRTRNAVEIFDELSDGLCRVADMSECVRVLHSDSEFVEAAEETNAALNSIVENLNTNRTLYRVMKNIADSGQDIKPMDDVERRVANLFLVDFELAGIQLEDEKRKQVVDLNAKILTAGLAFVRRCFQPHFVDASLIPDTIKPYFHQEGRQVVVNNLMSDAPNEAVREAAYKVFLMSDKEQVTLLRGILKWRFQLANLVGFPSFTARTNTESIFRNTERISTFLQTLSDKIRPQAEAEAAILLKMKKREKSDATTVFPWDITYLIGQARKEGTQGTEGTEGTIVPSEEEEGTSQFETYFPLGACVEGLSQLFHSLYNVHFVVEDPSDQESLWWNDVYKLSVRTAEDEVLGYIYCDFYMRPEKPMQDCHFTIEGGRRLTDGTYQLPKVVLSLNYTPPESSTPSLMHFWQIENLFHEMGHAMHSMLGRARYQHVTGTRTSTDFAEIPSTLMEYFASDYRVLSKISRHYQTGASLSEDVLRTLCASRKKFSAIEFQMQNLYAIVDQSYHGPVETTDPLNVYAALHNQHLPVKYVPNTGWPLRFGHLYSYGARYYSYLLARAVASDIWLKLFKADPYSREAGRKLRDRLLCHGGGRPPLELISDTLEHTPTIEELVDALVDLTKT